MSLAHPHVGRSPAQQPLAATEQPGEPRFRIGEAARRVGVSASALRLWERQGLIRPHRTERAGYRLYSAVDLGRLRRIRRLREVDRVNAPGIRRLLRSSAAEAAQPDGRLRAMRRERRLSLREASRRSGLSVSFISALERGASGASVAALQRLTSAYGSTMLELLGAASSGRLTHPGQRAAIELDGGKVRIEQLSNGTTLLEPQLFVLAPGASSEGAYAHEGEELLYLLEGRLRVWLGADESYRLAPGDALSFPSSLPHRWRNEAKRETRLLWINTPPTF